MKLKVETLKEKTRTTQIGTLKQGDVFYGMLHDGPFMVVAMYPTLQNCLVKGAEENNEYAPTNHVLAVGLETGIVAHWSRTVEVTPVREANLKVLP